MKILFIGGQGRLSDANSVCIRNMAKEMLSRGHKVWILATGREHSVIEREQDGAFFVEVPMDYYSRLILLVKKKKNGALSVFYKIVSLLRHIFLLPFYPHTSPYRSIRLAHYAKKLVENNEIDLVVSTYCPFENIYAGIRLKKRFGRKIKVVSYHLDLRTGSQNSSSLVRRYIHRHSLNSLIKENKIVDKMLIPYSGFEEMNKVASQLSNKVQYVGFPVFIVDGVKEECALPFEENTINISYIGTLNASNRNPQYFIDLLEMLSSKIGINVLAHFWGDMGSLENVLRSSHVTRYHGKIDSNYVRYILDNSDFLLNIGNRIAYEMLPSKIFSLFATGKPIINMITHPKDASLPFFDRYKNSVGIREYYRDPNDVTLLADFIESKRGVEPINVNTLFDDFTPAFLCNLIISK